MVGRAPKQCARKRGCSGDIARCDQAPGKYRAQDFFRSAMRVANHRNAETQRFDGRSAEGFRFTGQRENQIGDGQYFTQVGAFAKHGHMRAYAARIDALPEFRHERLFTRMRGACQHTVYRQTAVAQARNQINESELPFPARQTTGQRQQALPDQLRMFGFPRRSPARVWSESDMVAIAFDPARDDFNARRIRRSGNG